MSNDSKLSKQVHTVSSCRILLSDLASEAPSLLLFLKHVENIRVLEWLPGESNPRLISSCSLENVSEELRNNRSFATIAISSEYNQRRVEQIDFPLEISCTSSRWSEEGAPSLPPNNIQNWFVCNNLGGGKASEMTIDTDLSHMRLVPWGAVAARVKVSVTYESEDAGSFDESWAIDGRAYCFLPLPARTGLPVHVNGYFELSSNRRDIWYGDDMIGDGKLRSDWNYALLSDVIAPAYARLISKVASYISPAKATSFLSSFYSLWPPLITQEPWKSVAQSFYSMICALPIFMTMRHSGEWINGPSSILVVTPEEKNEAQGSTESFFRVPSRLVHRSDDVALRHEEYETLSHLLVSQDVPIIQLPNHIKQNLLRGVPNAPTLCTPQFVREIIRESDPGSLDTSQLLLLLRYCLMDCNSDLQLSQISGLRLLPCADG